MPRPTTRHLITLVAAAAALFHLYVAGWEPIAALAQRPIHLALMAILGFLGIGAAGERLQPTPASRLGAAVRWALIAATLSSCGYLVLEHRELVRRIGTSTPLDLAAGALAVVVVLELTRRTSGWGLVGVAGVALLYGVGGRWVPGILAHRGYGPERLIEHLYLSTEGIWGIPLGVSADFVYLFVLFGALLDAGGGGELLLALADRVAGGTRGGAAKTASVASALMGSLSGSAVANVVTTGSLTIPLMRRSGFRPHFAAAVEAAASTGGQLMPPIMGAGAFILATWTRIPYIRVAAAAALPALLYYGALIAAIHFRAVQTGLEPAGVQRRETAGRLHLLVPLAVIVGMLAAGRSPMRAAFWGVAIAALAVAARATTRIGPERLRRVLVGAAAGTVQVAAACATAGIVVGVVSLTGVGLRMSGLIVTLSGGHLPIALILTAVGSVILGMGLPTTAAYVVLAALGAPALIELGAPVLGAHLFIFYFGCISNVTPPVSLAAYAAAGLAGAPALQTAITAMGLAGAGILVPFLFVYGPALLLEGTAAAVLLAAISGLAGVVALAAALVGHARRPLGPLARLLAAAAAVTLILPGLWTDLAGIAVAFAVLWRGGDDEGGEIE